MRRASISGSSIDSPWVGTRAKESEQTIPSRVDETSLQDSVWWSATDGGAVIADAASSKKQAIANIADEFRLGAVQRLRLAKCHGIEVDGWRIALQKPDESCDYFLDRSCGQKRQPPALFPVANRRLRQQINCTQAKRATDRSKVRGQISAGIRAS